MSARDAMIAAIRAGKPAPVPLPVTGLDAVTRYPDPVARFITTLEGIGGKVEKENAMAILGERLATEKANGRLLADIRKGRVDQLAGSSPAYLEKVYLTCIRAELGVAENGAVWIPETAMENRLLPFICQHLAIVLEKNAIVSTLHHAYERIGHFKEGFGLFLAGPSKTADIEQSLVIGAHGARSLTVYLVD